MIRVAIAIAMARNPGRAVAAASPLARAPTVRLTYVDDVVTNFHAYWFAINLALERLDGRPAELLTNAAQFSPLRDPWRDHAYHELGAACVRRAQQTGVTVRFAATNERAPDTAEAQWIRWLQRRAQTELARRLEAAVWHDVAGDIRQ